jgi:uncharacterized membrane protein
MLAESRGGRREPPSESKGSVEMGKILENLSRAIALGLVLLIVVIAVLHRSSLSDPNWIAYFLMYVHVIVGILWIGLLYYFNFVQIPTMPKIPAELKPAVSKFIAPAALFWFRWAAAFTVLFGLVTAEMKEKGGNSGVMTTLTFQPGFITIGIGMWLAIIMAANVWFVIWPNQKKALGIVTVDDAAKAKAGRVAMLASRTNTVLSIPMLYCMIMQASPVSLG